MAEVTMVMMAQIILKVPNLHKRKEDLIIL